MPLAQLVADLLWGLLMTYVILGGILFGATFWEAVASGEHAAAQQAFVRRSIGWAWEFHHLWLLALPIALAIAFPPAYAALSSIFLIPAVVILTGLLLRPLAWLVDPLQPALARLLRALSLIVPLLLGSIAGIVASGQIAVTEEQAVSGSLLSAATLPFAIVIAACLFSLCVLLSATFLAARAAQDGMEDMAKLFRARALTASSMMAVLVLLGVITARAYALVLINGMLTPWGMFSFIATCLCWGGMMWSLLEQSYRQARHLTMIGAALLLIWWGLSQSPYLVPANISFANAAAPDDVLRSLLLGTLIVLVLVLALFRWRGFLFRRWRKIPRAG